MTSILDLLLWLVSLPVLLAAGYLLAATLLSRRLEAPASNSLERRFRIIVPAHNEAAGIAETVRSLLAVDYPASRFDVLVVADNCQDDTAERARAVGAQVLERQDSEHRGKGYALHHTFERLPADVDAVVVVDADTLVSPNLLRAFAARRNLGADAIQADYAVRNPNASWRTRLIAIAFGSFHIVRSRARERLRLSCGLRGNGMCFSAALLAQVPHEAYSIVEDVRIRSAPGRGRLPRVLQRRGARVWRNGVRCSGRRLATPSLGGRAKRASSPQWLALAGDRLDTT